MYSKLDASRLRQDFWTAFGQYMAPVPSAEGLKVNWINYKTGVKNFRFAMDAGTRESSVMIVIHHSEEDMRRMYYERLVQLQPLFSNMVGSDWLWRENAVDESNRAISKIEIMLPGVNVFDQNSWPAIISFLKEKMIALDAFWSLVKDGFEALC